MKKITFLLSLSFCLLFWSQIKAQNDVMMQVFYWDVPVDEANLNGDWWNTLSRQAPELKESGITGIWTPCPSKGNWGIVDNGYGIYDHYDLGNYNQKGSTETRFGSRAELEQMIRIMHQEPKIEVYSDVVLNHLYSSDENEEVNPAVKAYVFGEAHGEQNSPYPSNEIRWVIPNASPGDYYIQIKGYCLPWDADQGERGYDVMIRWDNSSITESGQWEYEPNNGGGSYNDFPGSGKILRAHMGDRWDIDEYKISVSSTHDIEIRLTAKRQNGDQWGDAGTMFGYYPKAIWYNGTDLAQTVLEARTNTHISYVNHTGRGEPNCEWHYNDFHPVDGNDWLGGYGNDEIITNTKFFGNDINTFDPRVVGRLKDWGVWLMDEIGFDGFRLDFVRGFQEGFVAEWVSNLPKRNGKQPFIVGEYWGSGYRIKNWVNTVASLGADVDGFDFPLKGTLTHMCNSSGGDFDMSWLNHAGMVRNNSDESLPGTSIVTFLDNHDTGKEHDKWVTKDFHLGYAYLLTHEGRPCLFYPHFYGVTQHDSHDRNITATAPGWLGNSLKQLIHIRKTYLGGGLVVLSEIGNPYPGENTHDVYIARRQGNGVKDGAIIVLNNNDSQTKSMWVTVNADGFSNWTGQTLVNVLNTSETVTVQADGRVEFSAPARSYSIWVKASDLEASSLRAATANENSIISVTPSFPTQTGEVKISFNTTGTVFDGYTGDLYLHTGVVTDKSNNGWVYVKTGWGENTPETKAVGEGDNLYSFTVSNPRAFYGVPEGEQILKIAFLFRTPDSDKQTSDFFAEIYKDGLNVRIETPDNTSVLVGNPLTIAASASVQSTLKLFVDNVEIASLENATEISKQHIFNVSGTSSVRVEAQVGNETETQTISIIVVTEGTEEPLPVGVRPGINYMSDTEVVLVLQAPGKGAVHVIGDFNNWEFSSGYQLKKDGEYFWITLTDLIPGREYAFQYLVDGSLRIADPYTDKILDPWNDKYIPESVYPNLKTYPDGKTEGIVSILQTAQAPYQWQVTDFNAPSTDNLIIYEMLIRDFTEEHSFNAAKEKLSYLKEMGVNAIELMPVNEFEGNSSWGYNPSFYFAVDKYYGTKDNFKSFIDECHKNGMAVIIDLVLNHSYGQSPFYQLYKDADGRPSVNNPWYNQQSNLTNPSLQWGYDFNHDSPYTRALVDSVAGFWMKEYKIDGFRYDFTKGFSNTTPADEWANTYDQARIDNLKRMANEVWKRKPDAYVILEHLTDNNEEQVLGETGMLLWRNMNWTYCQSAMGWVDDSNFSGLYAGTGDMPAGSIVGYMESHDEERMAYKAQTWGNGNIATDLGERMKQLANNTAFFLTVPGPKMIWQFGELGYDISIEEGGRTSEKPVLWNYYDEPDRRNLYTTYSKISALRHAYPEFFSSDASFSWKVTTNDWDNGRFITINSGNRSIIVAGNFTNDTRSLAVNFTSEGAWYNYMTNEAINVINPVQNITVPAHEFRIFTNFLPDVSGIRHGQVSESSVIYPNPVSDILHIQTAGEATIAVYSISGNLLKKAVNANNIFVGDLSNGVYLVKITTPGSDKVVKFIKE